ncbi:MAG: acylphosphatase [Patescibacteria group bacterium]|nr:acylphosphatase [Patescibacteria group bacterium]
METNKQVKIKVYGQVQMVMFRDATRRQARKLNLTGWVKNEIDDTVQIIAEGREERLKELVEWCYNGPVLARVDKIDVEWTEASGLFNKFEIKY